MHYGDKSVQLQFPVRVGRASPRTRNYSLAVAALLFAALSGVAQETTQTTEATAPPPQSTQNQPQPTAPEPAPMIVLPAGTRLPLVLQRGISTRTTRPGDMVYLLTTAPVTADDRMVIPPNTFVQGQIGRITMQGVDRDGELQVRSANMIFPNGYAVRIPYDFVVPLDRAWIYPEAPTSGRAAGLAAVLAAPGVGALIGGLSSRHNPTLTLPVPGQPLTTPNLGNPLRGAAIGAGIGFGIAIPVAVVLLRHHRDFYVDGGLPSEMILEQPLALQEDRIAAAGHQERTLAVNPLTHAFNTALTMSLPGLGDSMVSGPQSVPGTPAAGEANSLHDAPDTSGTPDAAINPSSPGSAYPYL